MSMLMASNPSDAETSSDDISPGSQTLTFDDDALKAKAEVYLHEGDSEYEKDEFYNAIDCYTRGIKAGCRDKSLNATLFTNRATVHLYMGDYYAALSDAKTAKKLQPTYMKAIERGASACVELNLFREAIIWCDEGLANDKDNKTLSELKNTYLQSKTESVDKKESCSQNAPVDDKIPHGETSKNARKRTAQRHVYRSLGIKYLNLNDPKTALDYFQLVSLGDFKTAIEFQQKALGIAREAGNKDSEGTACIAIGIAYSSLGDFKTALKYQEQALSVFKELGKKALEAAVYVNLGLNYHSLGDFKTSIEFYDQALGIAKEDRDKALQGSVYISLGITYHSLGELNRATESFHEGLNIAQNLGDKKLEGKAYCNLGLAYRSLGDFKTTIEFEQLALTIAKDIGDQSSKGKAYTNLGLAYDSLGDFKTAIEFHEQALSMAKEVKDKASEGKAYTNLANTYQCLDDFQTAIEFHEQALDVAKEVGNKASEGKVYSNLGGAYRSLGNFNKAIEVTQQALGIAKEVGDRTSEGKALINLGLDYHSIDDLKTGLEYTQQGVAIAKEVGDKVSEGTAYGNLGSIYYSLGNLCKAEDFYKLCVDLRNEIRDLLQSRDEWKINLRNQYKDVYTALWSVQLEHNKPVEALFTAERGRAQALMDLMESQYRIRPDRQGTHIRIEAISDVSTCTPLPIVFLAGSPKSISFWLLQKEEECRFMYKETNNSLKSLTDQAYKEIGVFKRVMSENRSLDETTEEEFEDGESEELPDRSPNGEGRISRSYGEVGALKELSDMVFSPISHLIQSDEVIIVPDGELLLVPYGALMNQNSEYLSERLRIRLVPSLTSLKLLAECPEEYHSTSGALLVGDPWVESVRIKKKRVSQLPAAKREVEMIGKILNIEHLTGKNATKAEVLSRLSSVALVHIAAHGCAETGEIVLSPNPTQSRIPKEQDFLLTMADVLNASLRTKLVVLSCCHSGRGKIKAEGVVGIARAFLGAGARSVIASLWAISDEATLEFMRKFYEHLVKGQSASTSLNQAMKWMRETVDFREVKYWAPFVLIGDDVTLKFDQTS